MFKGIKKFFEGPKSFSLGMLGGFCVVVAGLGLTATCTLLGGPVLPALVAGYITLNALAAIPACFTRENKDNIGALAGVALGAVVLAAGMLISPNSNRSL